MQESYPIARAERTRPLPDENFLPPPREKKRAQKKSDPKVDLMLVQLILCGIALLAVFGCKLIGGELYENMRTKYITLVCDRTALHQVLDAMSTRFFDTSQQEAAESAESLPAEGGSDDANEPYIDNYDVVAEELENNVANINTMALPLNGTITSGFAYRVHPITGKYSMHGGVDIAANAGSEICAAADGVVNSAKSDVNSGNYLILDHNESLSTMYAHCQKLLVEEGEAVKKGQVIALVGSTGMSTGPHLHFELRLNGVKLNPEWILDFSKAS